MEFYDKRGETHEYRIGMYLRNIAIMIDDAHIRELNRWSDAMINQCRSDILILQHELCPWCLMNTPDKLGAMSRIMTYHSMCIKDSSDADYLYRRLVAFISTNGNLPQGPFTMR